jgi:F-box protein 11
MRTAHRLLKFLARAALPAIAGCSPDEFLAPVLPVVAEEVWLHWSRAGDENRLRAELQALARASVRDVGQQAERLADRVASGRSAAVREALLTYLTQAPAAVRQALRRAADPTGTTVPPTLPLRGADDLVRFLPVRLPRFHPGDRPAGIGDWELEELLGFGGLGEVWKARRPGAPAVALRFCFDPAAARALRGAAPLLERVLREAKHPGIVPLLGVHLKTEPPCLVYEYVMGGDLTGLIHEWHRSPTGLAPWFAEQAARLVQEVAAIVGFAHRLEPALAHRDLKPASILCARQGGRVVVRIADWGLSEVAARQAIERQTRRGPSKAAPAATLRGAHTPLYASPQQLWGERPDPRDDVHALGVLWLQMLTGDLGAGRPDDGSLGPRLAGREMPPRLLALLAACLADDPAARPADAAALAAQLAEVLGPPRVAPPRPRAPDAARAPRAAKGPTVVVAVDGSGRYKRIGEAVRDTAPGTRILVRPGVYQEGLLLVQDMEIVGDGSVDSVVLENTDADCIYSFAAQAVVRGLTIRSRAGTKGNHYFAVEVPYGQIQLEDCAITSDSLACVAVHGVAADPVFRRCRIHGGAAGGLFVWNEGRGTFLDCDISGHAYSGVEIKQGGNPILRRCKVHGQGNHNGVMIWDHGKGTLEECEVFGNRYAGIRVSEESDPVVRRCKIHDGQATGIYVCENGRGLFEDCETSGHVNAEVEVRTGAAPILSRCRISGGQVGGIFLYDNATGIIEDCEIAESPTAGLEIKQGANPVLRRCTIHGGKASGVFVQENGLGTLEECVIHGNAYAGVSIRAGGNPTLRRCKIRDGQRGGIFVYEDGKGTLEDCDISGNSLSGIEVRDSTAPVLRHCRLRDGQQCGVMVWSNGGATVEDCDIAGNAYAGVEVKQGGKPVVRRSKIRDGKTSGVFVWDGGLGTVEECTIVGNALAGVEIKQGGNPVIRKCRIDRARSIAVWVHDKGVGTVENCDLTGESGQAWKIEEGCDVKRSGNRE